MQLLFGKPRTEHAMNLSYCVITEDARKGGVGVGADSEDGVEAVLGPCNKGNPSQTYFDYPQKRMFMELPYLLQG